MEHVTRSISHFLNGTYYFIIEQKETHKNEVFPKPQSLRVTASSIIY